MQAIAINIFAINGQRDTYERSIQPVDVIVPVAFGFNSVNLQ